MPQFYFNSKVRFSKVVDYGEQIMSNKPIEVGCRVLVIKDDLLTNIGKLGIVVEYCPVGIAPPGYAASKSPIWKLESLGENFKLYNIEREFIGTSQLHWFAEECLVRLPDEDEVERFDREQELENP